MNKKSNEDMNFIEKTMKTLKVELTVGERSLFKAKTQRGIFQRVALSLLSCCTIIITMMPLNHILRKCTTGYELGKSQKKINHLIYVDDIKVSAKNEKELETLKHAVRIYTQELGMEFGMET